MTQQATRPDPIAMAARYLEGASSGLEGRELELGHAVATAVRTLRTTTPYPHEINDALVKSHLLAIQFAKNQGLLAELVAHDIATMEPVNRRLGSVIEATGNTELALVGIVDHTACHYHLVLDTEVEPGRRSWTSPFGPVLEVSRRLGQFDLTDREVHETWTTPRLLGYAATMGVELVVAPWQDDARVSISVS